MKTGTQADLLRYLESECDISVSRNAISLLVKDGDYRIIKTKGGKIKIEETAKSLVNSGFGKRSAKLKAAKKNKPAATESKQTKPKNGETDPLQDEIKEYLDGTKQVTLASPPAIIHRYKEFQQAEKERIKNEQSMKKLVDFDQTSEIVFNFFRSLRDDLQEVAKRVSPMANMASTKQEANKIISDEITRILVSKAGEDYQFDDLLKKKIILMLRAQLR